MPYIINGRKYCIESSETLHESGDGRSLSPDCGFLGVYRSPGGTLWARHYYWANEGRDVERLAEGEEEVKRLIGDARRPRAFEAVFEAEGRMADKEKV